MYENNEVLDWDDEISEEGSEFIVVPEGDYKFTVTKFERGNYEPSATSKIPACKMAIVTFTIQAPEGDITIKENFQLCKKMEWKLSSLFLSIGLKKHDEPLRMNWQAITGCTGYCHVYVDNYTKKDGSSGQSNKIKKLYAYDEQPKDLRAATTVQTAAYTPQYAANNTGWKPGSF